MFRTSIVVLFLLITEIIHSQDSTYISAPLINGCPQIVLNNKYFSSPGRFSYTPLKSDNNGEESLYFFIEKVSPDSSNYILIYMSGKVVSGNSYMKIVGDSNSGIHLKGDISVKYSPAVYVDAYYKPGDNKILLKLPADINRNGLDNTSNLFSLSHIELGVRDDWFFMSNSTYDYLRSKQVNETRYFPLPLVNLHLSAGLWFNEYFKIDYRVGLMIIDKDIYGLDNGIFINEYLYKGKFFVTAGIDYFVNFVNVTGALNYYASGGNFLYYCFGIGYRTSKHITVDLMYYTPNDKVFGYNIVGDNFSETNFVKHEKVNNGVIKVGIQYSFFFNK